MYLRVYAIELSGKCRGLPDPVVPRQGTCLEEDLLGEVSASERHQCAALSCLCTIYSGCKVTFIIIHLLAVYQNVWCRPALPVKYFMSNKL